MRLWGILAVLAALTAGGTFLERPRAAGHAVAPAQPVREGGCKPTAPINLEARLVGDPNAGFSVEASARARSGAEVELEIVLPDGIAHVAGPRKLKGKQVETRVDARVRKTGRQEILVSATFTEGGARMTRVIPLVLNDAPPLSRGKPARSARGDAVLEFAP